MKTRNEVIRDLIGLEGTYDEVFNMILFDAVGDYGGAESDPDTTVQLDFGEDYGLKSLKSYKGFVNVAPSDSTVIYFEFKELKEKDIYGIPHIRITKAY